MSNQGLRQASARNISLTTTGNNYEADLRLAAEAEMTIPAGATFNEALLLWINNRLSASYQNLPEAQQALAESLGAPSWNGLTTLEV